MLSLTPTADRGSRELEARLTAIEARLLAIEARFGPRDQADADVMLALRESPRAGVHDPHVVGAS